MKRNTPIAVAMLLVITFAALVTGARADDDDYVLKLPEDPLRLTIKQRETLPIPGLHKAIRIHLDDITAGQALVEVNTIDDRELVRRRSLKQGEVVSFELGGKRYYVHVVELKNFLIGDDYGVFDVSTTPPPATRPATQPTTDPAD